MSNVYATPSSMEHLQIQKKDVQFYVFVTERTQLSAAEQIRDTAQ